jgi:hypothetical protein
MHRPRNSSGRVDLGTSATPMPSRTNMQELIPSRTVTRTSDDTAALFVNGVFHDECLMRRESESNL